MAFLTGRSEVVLFAFSHREDASEWAWKIAYISCGTICASTLRTVFESHLNSYSVSEFSCNRRFLEIFLSAPKSPKAPCNLLVIVPWLTCLEKPFTALAVCQEVSFVLWVCTPHRRLVSFWPCGYVSFLTLFSTSFLLVFSSTPCPLLACDWYLYLSKSIPSIIILS